LSLAVVLLIFRYFEMERFSTDGGRTVKIPVLHVELLKQWWLQQKDC
jgi:hypothetical protein